MKMTKKMLSLVLVTLLILSLSATAFAAGTHKVTIENATDGYTYVAYQIFVGDEADGVLSNITKGENVTDEGMSALYTAFSVPEEERTPSGLAVYIKETKDAAKVADTLKSNAAYMTGDGTAFDYDSDAKKYTASLVDGYYLFVNTSVPAGEGTAYSDYMVNVIKDETLIPKADIPTVDKTVTDKNDSSSATEAGEKTADYDIGDSVPFQLKATMPSQLAGYTTYKLVLTDALSKGLTYQNDAVVKLYIDGDVTNTEETNVVTITGDVDFDAVENILTVTVNDVLALGGNASSVIFVDYTAVLNTDAAIGGNGNDNTVYMQYSNNPNGTEMGKTPKVKVTVFTFELVVDKVDEENNPLAGAGFTLYKEYATDPGLTACAIDGYSNYYKVKEIAAAEDQTQFTFTGLDDGNYLLVESETPAGYNTIEPIEFTIEAEHNVENGITELKADPFSVTAPSGLINAEIINNAGTLLPSTGGIGTTIFYIVGAVLLVGAGIILVTRKRVGSEE